MQGVPLTRIADNLSNEYQIGAQRDKPRQYCRFIQLRCQQLFDRLVSLYTQQFIVSYGAFKHALRVFEHPPGVTNESNAKAAARAYISSWFWDLYVSISKSVWKIHSVTGSKYYSHNIAHNSDRYDPFLQHLNSVIRPTHTPQSLEDVLWIPIFMATPLSTTNDPINNPFDIIGWNYNDMQVQVILDTMDNRKNQWRTVPLCHDTLGRPMWLLDWHDDRAYAWFPLEGHFTYEDLVAAYILGLPCTPNLGPRDNDEWNFFPGNIVPADLTPAILPRTTPRNFYGSAEVRTYNLRNQTLPEFILPPTEEERTRKKSKSTEPTSCALVTGSFGTLQGSDSTGGTQPDTDTPGVYPKYQIVDWCYHLRVVLELNSQLQNASFRSFLFQNQSVV